MVEVTVRFRVWVEIDGQHLIGPGGYEILKAIDEAGSLSGAARKLGMSYRFVWNYVNRMEKVSGIKLVETNRGSRGGARLTREAQQIIQYYEGLMRELENASARWGGLIREVLEKSRNRSQTLKY
ncbi:winged helix-turn-helix domain-containing protein [Vulcanisaeta thermophila]|uniref:winged helix-turn-helix domain-containing protein n=1 Tax=Vulcanisaeta thermophila TaxID=867917 RepID=UPI000853DCBA|nr:winged helix-turn-helix domain-containing protein [Vulcanisaeta thermophila]